MVALTPMRARGLVNAVLRRVAEQATEGIEWPSTAVALSYPDWIVSHFVTELGETTAIDILQTMNEPAPVTVRPDGYVQDLSSQAVMTVMNAGPHDFVVDTCAAPGGKATGVAPQALLVLAADRQPPRARIIADNVRRLSLSNVLPVVSDGRRLPVSDGVADITLVDAPCSGLGVLRRRPDARWRIQPQDVKQLAILQEQLLEEAVRITRVGGRIVYSVCTISSDENEGVVGRVLDKMGVAELPVVGEWELRSPGARLLPTSDHDGMYVAQLQRVDQ